MSTPITIILDGPDWPVGEQGSVNKLLNFLRENWGGSVDVGQQGVLPGQIGGTLPSTNVGLVVLGRTIYVWDDDLSKYVTATDVPIGSMIDWAGPANSPDPDNYLLCDGRTLQNTVDEYKDLFGVIGFTWGQDGATGFKLPDARGRVVVGSGVGDYASNTDPAVTGKMKERLVGSYSGTEWVQKQVKKTTGAPTQTGSVNGGIVNVPTGYTGVMQPFLVCRKLIRIH